MKIILVILSLALTQCVNQPPKPTVLSESPVLRAQTAEPDEIVLSDKLVIVDARPYFEYSMSHLPNSLHLRWEDFSQVKEPVRGLLEKDTFFLTRRLARLGISPDTPVVVVGRGPAGLGEEGRMAWTLKYLGVKDVRFCVVDYFQTNLVNSPSAPLPNAPIWKPNIDESLVISRDEFLKHVVRSKDAENSILIDVRPSLEFLGKVKRYAFSKRIPDVGAINIPWTEFFTAKGFPKADFREQLTSLGITPEKRVVVVSDFGAESAAVTLALRDLGYKRATNFAGGYMELVGKLQ